MRISDWSSDVCSSDLSREAGERRLEHLGPLLALRARAADARAVHGELVDRRLDGAKRSVQMLGEDMCEIFGPALLSRKRVLVIPPQQSGPRQGEHQKDADRSEEHTSELQSLMRTSYAA